MKNLLLLLILLISAIAPVYSQTEQKFDVILKLNGEEMVGNISEIDDSSIKFNFKGEKLQYTLKKDEIQRITFASGRIEVLNQPKKASSSSASETTDIDSHNKVAVLPFGLIIDDQPGSEEMIYKIQTECYNLMSKKTASLKYQDPTTTNAILLQKGITRENFRAHTMDELCHILGVEFLVQGTVTVNKGALVSSTTGNANIKTKPAQPGTKPGENRPIVFPGGNTKATVTQTSTNTQNYKTSVTMNIFDEHGSKIYGKDHDSFWPDQDAYKSTLEFLAKRTPLYGR